MENIKLSESARIIGKVRIGENSYIAQGTVLRSIDDSIKIGNSSWVLENSVVIGTPEYPVNIGQKTIFGHKCIAIGTEIGDLCEIGNCTIFLPGSKIGNMCIFGEGVIIPENTVIPDNSVVVGRPGRIIRTLTDEDKAMISRMRGNNISLSEYIEIFFDNEIEEDGKMGKLYKYGDKFPLVSDTAYLFDTAEITGDVRIGENTIIGSGVRIIGDSHGPITIGNNVQILENSVLHLLPNNELIIEDNTVIGPNSMIHGTIIRENSIIESGAIICDNSVLGKNSLVKAGTLVKQRDVFEDNSIVEGFPGKLIGKNENIQEKPLWAVRKLR